MDANPSDISCIVLAGGRGQRFNNRDKGLIEFDGIRFIEHTVNIIKPQVDDIIISANRNLEIYKRYSPCVIQDQDSDYRGPLSGIATAIPHCRHDWVLVVPCDMPFLPANLVAQLFQNINNRKLSVATVENRPQLVFLMHRTLLAGIRKNLNDNQLKIMHWIDSHNYRAVEFSDYHAFDNINSEQDLSRLS